MFKIECLQYAAEVLVERLAHTSSQGIWWCVCLSVPSLLLTENSPQENDTLVNFVTYSFCCLVNVTRNDHNCVPCRHRCVLKGFTLHRRDSEQNRTLISCWGIEMRSQGHTIFCLHVSTKLLKSIGFLQSLLCAEKTEQVTNVARLQRRTNRTLK